MQCELSSRIYMAKEENCKKGISNPKVEIVESVLGNNTDGVWCNATWDTILCWPATRAGDAIKLHCPPLPGLDTQKHAYRTCSIHGLWEGKVRGDYSNPKGYTNYTGCYTPAALEVLKKYFLNKTPAQQKALLDIASGTRTMEVVGLWISLFATLLSLFIFTYFRSLRCHRTRIHRNLFVAIIAETVIRLVNYTDQIVTKLKGGEVVGATSTYHGAIYDVPIFCEILIVMQEYTKSVKFMWMLIEGIYLHKLVAVSVFSKKPNYFIFYAVGWGSPVPWLLAWAITMVLTTDAATKCWYLYYFSDYIWIIEAPRVAVIAVNMCFLLNIIRVLVLKLGDSHSNEAQVVKVTKAIKAAVVLLPLLGITNFVMIIEFSTVDIVAMAIWAYLSHFLVAFQGFIISLLYCFLNGEVQDTLRRRFCMSSPNIYLEHSRTSIRLYASPRINMIEDVKLTLKKRFLRIWQTRLVHSTSSMRRMSRSFSVFTSLTEVANAQPQNANTARTSGTANGHVVPLLGNITGRNESNL